MSLAAKRRAAASLEQTYGVSERRACRALAWHRRTKRRPPGQPAWEALVAHLQVLSACYPRCGDRTIFALLKAEQWPVRRETGRRLRKRAGLQVGKKARKRRPVGTNPAGPTRAAHPPQVWSYEFVHDETTAGRRLKCLTVLAAYTREGRTISCARSIPAGDVVQVRPQLFAQRGAPGSVKRDNGPEFIAHQVTNGRRAHQVATTVIEPGSPWQNGPKERVHGGFREGCLDRWLLASVQEARRLMNPWLEAYNHERPPGALDGLTPAAFAAQS